MRPLRPLNVNNAGHLQHLHRALIRWYESHRRDLPWRTVRDPYKILLSEIMLQQTQASRVIQFFHRWLRLFPSFRSLSQSSTSAVLRAWSGLGYNNRALRFHRLAKIIAQRRPPRLPSSIEELQSLPGIGKYTAHAVACFAFGRDVPVVDVNIKRIFTRLTTNVQTPFDALHDVDAWMIAERFLPTKNVFDWNQALMDLGAMVCTARKPLCTECPLVSMCASASSPVFLSSMRRKKKKEPSRRGIQRRLYRGRILKLLHGHPLTSLQIASAVWKAYSARDAEWLESVIEKMRTEGLLQKKRNMYSIA